MLHSRASRLWVGPYFRSAGQPVLRKEALEAGLAPPRARSV